MWLDGPECRAPKECACALCQLEAEIEQEELVEDFELEDDFIRELKQELGHSVHKRKKVHYFDGVN